MKEVVLATLVGCLWLGIGPALTEWWSIQNGFLAVLVLFFWPLFLLIGIPVWLGSLLGRWVKAWGRGKR